MGNETKALLIAGTFAIFLCMGTMAQDSSPRRGAGQEWLSWSGEERAMFVAAYLDGYLRGKTDACIAAGELFDQHKPVHNLEDMPDRRCFRHAKAYSRDKAYYVAIITDFYANHSQYRNIPREYMMLLLTDGRFKSADEIYQAALKGAIRTNF